MIRAEQPLRSLRSQLKQKNLSQAVHLYWAFSRDEFTFTPVFRNSDQAVRDLILHLVSLELDSFSITIDYDLPPEDKVFAHVHYTINCTQKASNGQDAAASLEARKPLVSFLQSRTGTGNSETNLTYDISAELLSITLIIPSTKIEVEKNSEPIDFEELHNKFPDTEMLKTLSALFSTQAPARIVDWKQAFANNDITSAHRIIHSLKGSASNISANRLARKSKQLEMELKIHNTVHAEELFAEIEKELKRVLNALITF